MNCSVLSLLLLYVSGILVNLLSPRFSAECHLVYVTLTAVQKKGSNRDCAVYPVKYKILFLVRLPIQSVMHLCEVLGYCLYMLQEHYSE